MNITKRPIHTRQRFTGETYIYTQKREEVEGGGFTLLDEICQKRHMNMRERRMHTRKMSNTETKIKIQRSIFDFLCFCLESFQKTFKTYEIQRSRVVTSFCSMECVNGHVNTYVKEMYAYEKETYIYNKETHGQ